MIIQFASDLHLEFPDNEEFLRANPIQPRGEILLLAGDIVPFYRIEQYRDFFLSCSDQFEKTYWIAGNHEYYHGNIANKTGSFTEKIENNVYLVNNHSVHHGNVRIMFSTLWTPISDENARHIQNGVNDYHLIKDGEKRFTAARSTRLFEENLNFLREAVAHTEKEKNIVVTHHVPTFDDYPREYTGSVLNEAFAVDLNAFIESSKVDYWIFGHHHRNVPKFRVGDTHLVTNQLGYVKNKEHYKFKVDCIIEV